MIKKIIGFCLFSALIVLSTDIVTAGFTPTPPLEILATITTFIRNILALIVALFIIVGAFFFVTSAGDDKKMEKGRNAITFAIIGAVLAAIAHGLALWLRDFVG
jgi:hypothetical protein